MSRGDIETESIQEEPLKSLSISLRLAAAGVLLAAAAWTQSFTGRISGAVFDPNGGAVSHAAITAHNEETGAERRVLTDTRGLYRFPELSVGRYTLRFEAEGFDRAERLGVQVDAGGETRADAALSAQTLHQTVTVTAEAPVLQHDSGSLAEVVDHRQVDSLPLNGRDYRRLAILVPGAAPRSPRGSLGSFTVNGQREKSNIFLIDGVDNNDSFRNQPSFNQGGVTGAQATILPVDAIAEVTVQTQGSAELGRNSGAIVNTCCSRAQTLCTAALTSSCVMTS